MIKIKDFLKYCTVLDPNAKKLDPYSIILSSTVYLRLIVPILTRYHCITFVIFGNIFYKFYIYILKIVINTK
jgi:hypothetical protein